MQVEFKIVYDPQSKQVQVTGPVDDFGLCHLMLDLARQALFQTTMIQAGEKRIVTPSGPVVVPRPS